MNTYCIGKCRPERVLRWYVLSSSCTSIITLASVVLNKYYIGMCRPEWVLHLVCVVLNEYYTGMCRSVWVLHWYVSSWMSTTLVLMCRPVWVLHWYVSPCMSITFGMCRPKYYIGMCLNWCVYSTGTEDFNQYTIIATYHIKYTCTWNEAWCWEHSWSYTHSQ